MIAVVGSGIGGGGGVNPPLIIDTTQYANVGAGFEDLLTFTLEGGTLARDGESLYIEWAAQMANNANNKITAVIFGATQIAGRSGVPDTNFARFHHMRITRDGATAQVGLGIVDTHGQQPLVTNTLPAETLANDISIFFRVQGVAANDIVSRYILIRKEAAPAVFV